MACKKIRNKMRKMPGGGGIFGILKTLGGAALTATGVGGPLGMGLMASGVGDITSNIAGNNVGKEQAVQQARQQKILSAEQQFANMDVLPSQEYYSQLMPYGGMIGSEIVELERGEPYRLPDGTIESIPTDAPTHKQGGVKITLPSGTKVLGKKKAMNGKEFKEMGRKLKFMQDKHNKALSENPTSLASRTSKRMLKNIQKDYNMLFEAQGEDVNNSKRFGKGGKIPKYDWPYEGNDNSMMVGYGSNWWDDTQEPQFTPNQPTQYNINQNTSPTQSIPYANEMTEKPDFMKGFDWKNTLSTAGALAPTLYNLFQGSKPAEQWNEQEFANPYANSSKRLMASRRYNIQPELEANRSNAAGYNRRLRESGLSKGQLLGSMQAGALSKTKADASTLSRAQNVNAQYMADQAQFDYGVGRDISQRRMQVRDINARSKAARRNMTSTGLSQLGQYSQIQQQQKYMKERDQQRLDLLPSLISKYLYNPTSGFNFIK